MIARLDFFVTVILFTIGAYTLLTKPNLIKKLIGLNIMETSVYLFFIAMGDVRLGPSSSQWARATFIRDSQAAANGLEPMVNPIPSALILTAIVVSVCVTSLALAIAIRLYEKYGTLDTRKMASLKG